MSIGENIKEIRKSKRMTMEALAERVGVSRPTILRYESGAINIPSDKIEAIARALNCSPAEIMGWKADEDELRITNDQLKFALFSGAEGITDKMLEEVMGFAEYVRQRENNKHNS